QHHQHLQPAWSLFQQQQPSLRQPAETSSAAFVLTSASISATVDPCPSADWESALPKQNSQPWQESSLDNLAESLSSPATFVLSPVESYVLNPVKDTQPVSPIDLKEPPKRSRGRPRLSDTSQTIRARNREAAHRCRQKTQKNTEKLVTQEAVLNRINKSLHTEATQLRGEILILKHMVLQHSGCGCPSIADYISSAAQNLVKSGSTTTVVANGENARVDSQNRMTVDNQTGDIDWRLFDADDKAVVSSLGSWSGFSDFDDAASHTTLQKDD
ncbi:hypothetical protein LY76DRAFT_525883, partial [Colletotrichum caudatum]